MSELINEHVKSEFKRFFEYAFKCNPQYWQSLSGWEVLGKVKTPEDDKLFNRLINNVIRSEDNLKRIISDSSLNSAQELKYYAYLFLKDMGRAEGFLEHKLPEVPQQFADIYDKPSKLMDIVRDPSKSIGLRQQALGRIKELISWNKLPATIFDKAVFDQEKWSIWRGRASAYFQPDTILDNLKTCPNYIKHIPVLFPSALVKSNANMEDLINIVPACGIPYRRALIAFYRAGGEQREKMLDIIIEAQTRLLTQRFAVAFEYGFFIRRNRNGSGYEAFIYILSNNFNANDPSYNYWITKIREKGVSVTDNSGDAGGKEAFYGSFSGLREAERIAGIVWQRYRKEQDEEYPARLAQYEKELEPATFSDSAIARAGDYIDSGYIALKNKIGEVKANELWNNPENLLRAIEGKFSGEWKNIFATRLFEISIVTFGEQKRVMAGLLDIYEDMFFGESFAVPLVDTNIVEIVDKNLLGKEEEKKEL